MTGEQQQAPSKKNSTEKQLGAPMVAKQGSSVPSSVYIIPNSNSSNSNNSNNTVDDDRNNLAPIGMVIGDGRLGGRTSRKQQLKRKQKQQDTNCDNKRKRRKNKQNTCRDEQLPASTFQSNDSSPSGTTLSIKVNKNNKNVPESVLPNVAHDYCFIQMLEEADKPESDDFWFRVSFESFDATNDDCCAEFY